MNLFLKSIGIVSKYLFWLSLVFSVMLTLIFFFGAKPVGIIEARYDLWRGRYQIQGYGLFLGEPPWVHSLYLYGIEYRHVAGCVVNDFIIDKVAIYNKTMETAIKRDLSVDIGKIIGWGEKKSDSGTEVPLVMMKTGLPWTPDNAIYKISDCFKTLYIDLDGDTVTEKICLRYLHHRKDTAALMNTSLVLDIFMGNRQLLRQELDQGFFFEERFLSFNDIDSDGKAELITQTRFSPNCSGCNAFRIYRFKKNNFELAFNLFNIKPDNGNLKKILKKTDHIETFILSRYKKITNTKYPCEVYDECEKSNFWFTSLNDNGRHVALFIADSPSWNSVNEKKEYKLFVTEFSESGNVDRHTFHTLNIYNPDGWIDVIGFLSTKDGKAHMLINSNDPSTGSGNPTLNIFNLTNNGTQKIGAFAGFHKHNIAYQLQDFDGNGNTEVVYVEDIYWPPGEPHASVIPIYSIAEYINGFYGDAKKKFKNEVKHLNGN